MSLATDILRQHINISPKSPRKTPPRNYIQLAQANPPPVRHTPRRYGDKWMARVRKGGVCYHLGMHDTPERANLAARMFRHWLKRFDANQIPTGPGENLPVAAMPDTPPGALLHAVLRGDTKLTADEQRALILEVLSYRS